MDARPATIADRYELYERVGQGGCGVVYRAADRHTGRPVAVKMLSHATRQNPSFVERLVREQQALQALAGTHAVAAIDLCRAHTGELCLVMEWLEGTDLEQRLAALEKLGTPLSVDELWRVIEPVLQTLEKAHELGIVHRDIKPANIFLLTENGGVRLLDFGFSRLKSSAALTAADTVMGSPSYIAPEAWQHGSKAIEKEADLYAAGVIVFRALAGRVPFEGASLVETMKLVTTSARPSLCALRSDLPPVMDAWVEHALAIAPEHRFQHASSFLEALAAALGGRELPPQTLPAAARHPEAAPPPQTTPGERQNAISVAFGRAASLLKRVASSLSRAPAPPPEATASAPGAPLRPAPAAPDRSVAPESRYERARAPEPDSLIAELLPTSLPPPAENEPLAEVAHEPLAPLAPLRTIAIEGPSEPPAPLDVPPASDSAPALPPAPAAPRATERPRTAARSRKRSSPKQPAPASNPRNSAPPKRAGKPKRTAKPKRAVSPEPAPTPKRTTAKPKAPKQASKKQAAQPVAAPQAASEPAATPVPDKRAQRAKTKTTKAASTPPKTGKRAPKQTGGARRAAAKPVAKSAREKSGVPARARASRRNSS